MKNRFYKAIVLIALTSGIGFSSVSCGDEFIEDVKNKGAFDSNNYFQNEEQSFSALVSVYDLLRKYSGGFENTVTFFNAASDDFYSGGGSPTDGTGIQSFSNYSIDQITVPKTYWNDFYQGIARANLLIQRIPDAKMNDQTRKRFVAEAKTLRALYYFELLKMFGNIPLILQPITAADDFYNIPQAEPQKVYEQIESDILASINDLPLSIAPTNKAEVGRISQGTARAILGKIYLYNNKKDLAAAQFAEVNGTPGQVSQYGYKLIANYNDLWRPDNKFTTESILEVMHTNKGNSDWGFWGQGKDEGNSICIMIGPRGYDRLKTTAPDIVSGWAFNTATEDLYNFLKDDPRFNATILNAKQLTANGEIKYSPAHNDTGYFLNKYLPRRDEVSNLPGAPELNYSRNYIVIRLADTYLMEAEALNGSGARAQALLDAVRARVGLPSIPVTLQAVKDERRRELAGEGHRWFDLVRWGEAPSKLASRGFKPNKNELLPIPYNELLNTKIKQNPGY
ncbi:SusD family [Chryseobacterium gleum]|uniref:SusD family n=2 Tax=Chryseobacterium gleum TaxID=250 RepID=A0A3S4LY25_CHRGE|nr:RagB/SusD family nutrient uptake outer membrane protein [Chryseobacterium gleum]EFK35086.1 SusD family protein [Chryseobacterium gleum ATCC 35910]MCE4064204.1 RagB/SusD family nutrient uptake outer membrane protein [Chryseobacterium gleum]QQY30887.1 RagB/SusD family nutrient uptake outer membrane protein [Chryseobacterium gleum]VEE04751.1 SusD family [Chryseobacterium gleum]